MTMIEFLDQIWISVVASAFFSLLWWSALKPRFFIAPKIARQFDLEDGQIHCSFKIINRSFFMARDIRVVLKRVKLISKGGHRIWKSEELARGEILFIKGYRPYFLNDFVECISVFSRPIDMEKIWTEDYHLEFTVTSTHSLSGISGFVEQRYQLPLSNSIEQGEHSSSVDFRLIPTEQQGV
jgi:hypothetical protein